MKSFDIAIAYRCYPKISKEPKYWNKDKLSMIVGGLKSMVLCLGDFRVKFFIIADGIPNNWKDKIIGALGNNDYEYIYTDFIGNNGTYGKQIEILSNQNDSEIVYFAEDDYLYNIHDQVGFKEGISLLKQKKSDFISLFDHPGYYKKYTHKYKRDYIVTENKIWKSESSTCCTFMTTKETLKETKNVLMKYTKGCWDHPMWLILTKINIHKILDVDYNDKLGLPHNKKPKIIQKLLKNFPTYFVSLIMARLYGRNHILFGKKYKLYVPVLSCATHLESDDVAYLVDWDNVYRDVNDF